MWTLRAKRGTESEFEQRLSKLSKNDSFITNESGIYVLGAHDKKRFRLLCSFKNLGFSYQKQDDRDG